MESHQAVTPAFVIGTILESLGGLLFMLVFIDFEIGSFHIRDYHPTLLYTIAVVSFLGGMALLIKDVMRKIAYLKAEQTKRGQK